jgi:hypothetical protein
MCFHCYSYCATNLRNASTVTVSWPSHLLQVNTNRIHHCTIEFVRLAIETLIAEYIKATILANPPPENSLFKQGRDLDTNTYALVFHCITLVALFPNGHLIRKVLATVAVKGHIQRNSHKRLKRNSRSS